MAAGLAVQLGRGGLDALFRAAPASVPFYLAFVAAYLALPLGDWLIFRRLWGVGWDGFAAALRKRVVNEAVFGYAGEAYFLAWARAGGRRAGAFAAVKDVAVTSALAGNGWTLVLLAAALPLAGGMLPPGWVLGAALSGLGVAAASVPLVLFRRRVLSLPARDIRWMLGVHVARQAAATLLLALTWALGVGGVPAGLWLVLAGARLLVQRLPFLPNKDLLFANLAVLLLGQAGAGGAVAELVAFAAALTLAVHVALTAGFALAALAARGRDQIVQRGGG
jgi:hypothetical protein